MRLPLIYLSVVFYTLTYGEKVTKNHFLPSDSKAKSIGVHHKRDEILINSVPCSSDEDCYEYFTPGIEHALEYNSTIVTTPICIFGDGTSSTTRRTPTSAKSGVHSEPVGYCSCDSNCLSYSRLGNDQKFYYCGPCGRVGSECMNTTCYHTMGDCRDYFCECKNQGIFYELYYCYVPYYGYEVALQMAIATCIIIAGCLILVSIYNAVGFRRMRRVQNLREMFRNEGNREPPIEDTPPKYDDVIEELPSYQEAVQMMKNNDNNTIKTGVSNAGFDLEETSAVESIDKHVSPESLRIEKQDLAKTIPSSDDSTSLNEVPKPERTSSMFSKDSFQLETEVPATTSAPRAKVKGIRKDRIQPSKLDLDYFGRETAIDNIIITEPSKEMKSEALSSLPESTIHL